ncbi:hypothetical protein Ddc_16986 [Ditylenchus destructor]|nr:hypothetical protein Ddc_16986 [Ditylenchus destructor]
MVLNRHAVDIEDEAAKRALTERMDKLEREKMQNIYFEAKDTYPNNIYGHCFKTATKKMKCAGKEPEDDDESEEQGGTGDANDLDSLMNQIYAVHQFK